MPKPKQFLKASKKGKQIQGPLTENEYLEAGVDAQEAGEKWRAGDVKKSSRFFVKALEFYEDGLTKFPMSFELAYNRAQLEFDLTQHPKNLKEIPNHGSVLQLLNKALESSRYALRLNQGDADIVFHTAQVMSSLVEELESTSELTDLYPLPLLEESLELFQRCFSIQELDFARSSEHNESTMGTSDQDMEDGGASLTLGQDDSSDNTTKENAMVKKEEQWVTLVKPVTSETLIDTILEQLNTLILMIRFGGYGTPIDMKRISWIDDYAQPLLSIKLPTLLKGAATGVENNAEELHAQELTIHTFIKIAQFQSTLADARFLNEMIDFVTYGKIVSDAWASVNLEHESNGVLIAAQSLITFNASLSKLDSLVIQDTLTSRWQALSHAQDLLLKTSKSSSVVDLEKIYLLRGDVDLLRYQLGKGECGYKPSIEAATTLLSNSEKFYRGAKRYAASTGDTDTQSEATVKEALVKQIVGSPNALADAEKEVGGLLNVLMEARDEGLVTEEQLKMAGLNLS